MEIETKLLMLKIGKALQINLNTRRKAFLREQYSVIEASVEA